LNFSELAQPASEPGSARQAALLLHAMRSDDRQWLLSQLPDEQRLSLMQLIAELNSLGIPANRALVDEAKAAAMPAAIPAATAVSAVQPPASAVVAAEAPPVQLPPANLTDQEFLAGLDARGIAEMSQLLRREPAGLAARLLRQRTWPWRDELVAALSPLQKQQIASMQMDGVGSGMQPSALDKALLQGLRSRCESALQARSRDSHESQGGATRSGALRSRAFGHWTRLFGKTQK